MENKLLDNFTGIFQTYPLQCMCEEAGNNYECRAGRAKFAFKKMAHLVCSSVRQSRYSCKGMRNSESSVRVYLYWKQVGVPSEYKTIKQWFPTGVQGAFEMPTARV